MNLRNAEEGKEYIIKDIIADVDFCLKNDLGISPMSMAEIIHNIYSKLKEK